MFDSDNIPLVTRVEAGTGVLVSYAMNDAGEGVWTATLDSDYVNTIIDKKLSDSDIDIAIAGVLTNETRIKVLEDLLGVNYVAPPKTVPSDSDIFRSIEYSQNVTNLSGQMKLTWKVISFDGNTIVNKDITIGVGSTKLNVLNSLMYSIKSDGSASKYINTIRFDDGSKIHFNWKAGFNTFKLDIVVTQTSDTVSFTVNQ